VANDPGKGNLGRLVLVNAAPAPPRLRTPPFTSARESRFQSSSQVRARLRGVVQPALDTGQVRSQGRGSTRRQWTKGCSRNDKRPNAEQATQGVCQNIAGADYQRISVNSLVSVEPACYDDLRLAPWRRPVRAKVIGMPYPEHSKRASSSGVFSSCQCR